MLGLRHGAAGFLLFTFLLARGAAWPTLREWWACIRLAALLLVVGGSASVASLRSAGSCEVALVSAVIPLVATLGARGARRALRGLEHLGLLIGSTGALLLLGPGFARDPLRELVLCIS